jgi:DNA-binding HxlR family transcriptional regulator
MDFKISYGDGKLYLDDQGRSRRRAIEAPDLSTEDWNKQILQEIEKLNHQYNDLKDTICKHCVNLSLVERYKELEATGYIKI